jgi:hypothetical protein
MTLSLRQSGGRLDGTLNVKEPETGINSSSPVQGTVSGTDVRLTATNAEGTNTVTGQKSGDCRALNLSMTFDGQTEVLAFRRR